MTSARVRLLPRLILLGLLSPISVFAQGGPFGLGLVIGAPTGLAAKYYINNQNAIDGALAWDMGAETSFLIQSSYLWHKFNVFQIDAQPIDFYCGIGGRISSRPRPHTLEDEEVLGVRGPLGLRHYFRKAAIEAFLEIALTLNVIPRSSVDLDLGIGGRYYF